MKNHHVETPLERLYWEREIIIGRLHDGRIKGEKRAELVLAAIALTNEMRKLEAVS